MIKKDQHYVPKLYLKRFSIKRENTHLRLFNVPSDTFIDNAALRHQAYQKYFYDKDGSIEDVLSKIENEAIKSIKKVDDDSNSFRIHSHEYLDILIYTLIQLSRTKARALEVKDYFTRMDELLHKGTEEIKALADDYSSENPAAFAVKLMAQNMKVAFDLDFSILINNSKRKFITSDNPVIEYNQFLESRKHPGGITGIGVKGIQYFFPLDPTKCILFYDKWTYKIGTRKNRIVEIKEVNDIDSLNLLQVINCTENVYFNEDISEEYIRDILQRSTKFEKPRGVNMDEYPQGENEKGELGYLSHTYSTDLKTKLTLSFIKETKQAKKYKMGNKAVHLRNENVFDM